MRRVLTAVSLLTLMLINTLVLIGPLLLTALLKLLLPGRRLKAICSRAVMWVAETWAEISKAIFALLTPTEWDIRGMSELRRDTSYLVISNHQSWVDVPALVEALNNKAPYFKFFLKRELIWLPLLGLAFWALDYPFMKRYSKEYLERHPEKKGKDLEITRRACEKFRDIPVTIVNFPEGKIFTAAEHARQNSPYRHLLRPKSGGLAFVLAALGEDLDALLDFTIVYPGERVPRLWELISGQVSKVIVDIQTRRLDPALWQGDYANDPAFRRFMHQWVGRLWEEKDQRITALKAENAEAADRH
ncbi:MAG: acyltransferase [Wenzhouxiangella sp.]|nr:MAG: acyltransferase [Wenzhouxiangella sp.]